jgi:thiamine-monophosphate kinase
MDEFSLIRRYFAGLTPPRDDVLLGIGDDAALLAPPAGEAIVVTSDTLIAGRHFPLDAAPADIGWKALAVNLSDLAAMGAQPRWFTLALSLTEADEAWLAGFAAGLGDLARRSGIALVGGDTTRGPLAITITAMGSVQHGQALRRSGARPGDRVLVSGTLGDAALALSRWQTGAALSDQRCLDLRARLDRPTPRIELGLGLRGLASAAIDVSDGLAGDLMHVLAASGVGASIRVDRLPASTAFDALAPTAERANLQLAGGDDYELCVCVPPERLATACDRAARIGVALTEIGVVEAESGLRWVDARGARQTLSLSGYRHFS